jgi:CHASE3 domain sensor protein
MDRRIFRFYGIRKKLIMYFLLTILLLGITSIFSYYNAKTVLKNTNNIITDYLYLNNLGNNVNLLMTELEKYLTSASSENLLNYYDYYNKLQVIRGQIPRITEYDYELLALKDIGYMLDELMMETDQAILAKRGRISSKYISYFQRSNKIVNILNYIIITC